MFTRINALRAGADLRPLRTSASLQRSASRFSRDLMSEGVFGHRPRILANRSFRHVAEALAMRGGRRPQVRATLRTWLKSPSHRRIVLAGSMRWLGAGMARGRFRGRPTVIWVLRVGA